NRSWSDFAYAGAAETRIETRRSTVNRRMRTPFLRLAREHPQHALQPSQLSLELVRTPIQKTRPPYQVGRGARERANHRAHERRRVADETPRDARATLGQRLAARRRRNREATGERVGRGAEIAAHHVERRADRGLRVVAHDARADHPAELGHERAEP